MLFIPHTLKRDCPGHGTHGCCAPELPRGTVILPTLGMKRVHAFNNEGGETRRFHFAPSQFAFLTQPFPGHKLIVGVTEWRPCSSRPGGVAANILPCQGRDHGFKSRPGRHSYIHCCFSNKNHYTAANQFSLEDVMMSALGLWLLSLLASDHAAKSGQVTTASIYSSPSAAATPHNRETASEAGVCFDHFVGFCLLPVSAPGWRNFSWSGGRKAVPRHLCHRGYHLRRIRDGDLHPNHERASVGSAHPKACLRPDPNCPTKAGRRRVSRRAHGAGDPLHPPHSSTAGGAHQHWVSRRGGVARQGAPVFLSADPVQGV